MKSPTPEARCAKGAFQIQSPIRGVNFSKINNPGQGQWGEKLTWFDLWNLLTINFPPCMIWSLVAM